MQSRLEHMGRALESVTEPGLLSNQGEKSINLYFNNGSFKKKY